MLLCELPAQRLLSLSSSIVKVSSKRICSPFLPFDTLAVLITIPVLEWLRVLIFIGTDTLARKFPMWFRVAQESGQTPGGGLDGG